MCRFNTLQKLNNGTVNGKGYIYTPFTVYRYPFLAVFYRNFTVTLPFTVKNSLI